MGILKKNAQSNHNFNRFTTLDEKLVADVSLQ